MTQKQESSPNTSPMALALAEARAAAGRDEVPVGACLAAGRILIADGNRMRETGDPLAHAELLVLRRALAQLGRDGLLTASLYITLEPCAMCAGAIMLARIKRLYYGAGDPKLGAVEHGSRVFSQPGANHRPEIYSGFAERESADLLRGFFARRRG